MIGDDDIFDISILILTGVPSELLFREDNYASDVIKRKLYSSDTIFKLLELIQRGCMTFMKITKQFEYSLYWRSLSGNAKKSEKFTYNYYRAIRTYIWDYL